MAEVRKGECQKRDNVTKRAALTEFDKSVTEEVDGERVYVGDHREVFLNLARRRIVREWAGRHPDGRLYPRSFVIPEYVDRRTVTWIMSSFA